MYAKRIFGFSTAGGLVVILALAIISALKALDLETLRPFFGYWSGSRVESGFTICTRFQAIPDFGVVTIALNERKCTAISVDASGQFKAKCGNTRIALHRTGARLQGLWGAIAPSSVGGELVLYQTSSPTDGCKTQ
jgi:hypothetical protein